MRAPVFTVLLGLLAAGCGAGDLRRHAAAFTVAVHPRMSVDQPSEDAVDAVLRDEPLLGARDEHEAAERVARALAWLEWLRRSGWLERLRSPACEPVRVPEPDVPVDDDDSSLMTLIEAGASAYRIPDDCLAAERVLSAVRALRDSLERTPFPGVLAPLRAAIAELAGQSADCEPPFTGAALAAVHHVFELNPDSWRYAGGARCASVPTAFGHVSLEPVRVSDPHEVRLEDRLFHQNLPATFAAPLVALEVWHGRQPYLVVLGRLGDEWRAVDRVGPAHAGVWRSASTYRVRAKARGLGCGYGCLDASAGRSRSR